MDMGVDVAGSNCWHSHSNTRMEYEALISSSVRGEAKDDMRPAWRRQPSSLNEGTRIMYDDPKGDAYAWNAHNRCGDISVTSKKVNQSIHGPRSL